VSDLETVQTPSESDYDRDRSEAESWDPWRLTPMIAYLVALGLFFYLIQWQNWNWGFIVGLVFLGVWMCGFPIAARDPKRTWFRW
jgi:hypothetical protein